MKKTIIYKILLFAVVISLLIGCVSISSGAVITETTAVAIGIAALAAIGITMTANSMYQAQINGTFKGLANDINHGWQSFIDGISWENNTKIKLSNTSWSIIKLIGTNIKTNQFSGQTSGSGYVFSESLYNALPSKLVTDWDDGDFYEYYFVNNGKVALVNTDYGVRAFFFTSSDDAEFRRKYQGSSGAGDLLTNYTWFTIDNQDYYAMMINSGNLNGVPYGTYVYCSPSLYDANSNTFISNVLNFVLTPSNGSTLSVSGYDVVIPDIDDDNGLDINIPQGAITDEADFVDLVFDDVFSGSSDFLDNITFDEVSSGSDASSGLLQNIFDKISSFSDSFTDSISNVFTDIKTGVQAIASDLAGFASSVPSTFAGIGAKLQGIWYYVVQWVTSITPFFNTVKGVWNGLPPAMVYPIYACLVITIVFGLLKRFF